MWPRILLALHCLLALATPASAEGAWVLWTYPYQTGTSFTEIPGLWFREAAYDTRTLCLQAGERTVGGSGSGPYYKVLKTERGWAAITDIPERSLRASIEAQCWPDTIDPRGPKGK
jgi:hypothetical protein